MPNRIIKESICTSENVDKLSAFHETVFYRLIVNCDDYGRMDARPKLLASKLFPLKDIRTNQMDDALRALTSAELVDLYEVDGKPFLQMKTWDKHQQVRAKKSKYPSPDEGICNQLISDDSKCPRNPIQSESNPNPNANAEHARKFTPPTADEVAEYCESIGFQIDPQYFIDYYTARGWELKPGQKVKDWRACVRTWKKRDSTSPPSSPPKKAVSAQKYEQRDYTDVQNEFERAQTERILQRLKGAG